MDSDHVVQTSRKASLAQKYWEMSQTFAKRPDSKSYTVRALIDGMATLAGTANHIPWGRLEDLAAERLQAVIEMKRPRRKKTTQNVVPFRQATPQA